MSPRPHEGPAEEGLSSSLLQIVHDPERVDRLREALSGFCHQSRNSLNGIKMSLYLFRREARGPIPECWDDVETIYQEVVSLFDRLQTIYRPITLTMVRSPLDMLIHHHILRWRSSFEARGLAIRVDAPDTEVPADFDPAQLGLGLDAIAAWRAEVCAAGTLTRIAWTARDGTIELCWEEVVPHHPSHSPGNALGFVPRARNTARRRVDLLELPLLARIIAAHGGRIDRTGGTAFQLRLRWPQFQGANIRSDA
jgi:hypothetical protein